MIGLLGSILPTVNSVIERVVPDKNAQAKAKIELASMAAQGELDQMAGQLKINAKEAESAHWFVAPWRPAVGWLCVLILFNNYVLLPYASAFGLPIEALDGGAIMPIIMGMLGIGGARTYEKMKGVAREKIK